MHIKQGHIQTSVFVTAIPVGTVFYGNFRGHDSLWLKCENKIGKGGIDREHSLVELKEVCIYRNIGGDEMVSGYVPREEATLMVP